MLHGDDSMMLTTLTVFKVNLSNYVIAIKSFIQLYVIFNSEPSSTLSLWQYILLGLSRQLLIYFITMMLLSQSE